MKTSILVICLLALLCLVGWTTYAQKQNSKTTWEYMVKADHSLYAQYSDLKALGAEGWELVAVTSRDQMVQNQIDIETKYYLKRQK
jgi:hypothetical protein